jgi:hypothetical protein
MSVTLPQNISFSRERLTRPFAHRFRKGQWCTSMTEKHPWSAVTHTVGSVMEVSLEQQKTTATNTYRVLVVSDAASKR